MGVQNDCYEVVLAIKDLLEKAGYALDASQEFPYAVLSIVKNLIFDLQGEDEEDEDDQESDSPDDDVRRRRSIYMESLGLLPSTTRSPPPSPEPAKEPPRQGPAMIEAIEPYDDRMLIELLPPQEVTEGGIILPEAYRGRDAQRDATAREGADPRREVVVARVLTVGPGRPLDTNGRRFPMATQRGDIVLVGGYAGIEVRVGRRDDLKIVRETDIVARLRRKEATHA